MPKPTAVLRNTWSNTLRLPKSAFPARAIVADRAKYLKRCSDDLYEWQRNARGSKPRQTFTLHDGPPYANGSLHVGHALNKILKDISNRYQLFQGKHVHYVPGWDCHGLPIELKALQRLKEQENGTDEKQLGLADIRKLARSLASETVEEQKAGFREWAIMGDWDNAWTTMDKDFEIRQLQVFQRMQEQGLIYRKYKPVYWSPSTRTALAEAELEYKEDHVSLSAFVKFPMDLPSDLEPRLRDSIDEVSALIWTTTPWTLPANKIIAVHRDLEYTIVRSRTHGLLLVAAGRVSEVEKLCKEAFETTDFGTFLGCQLTDGQYYNPLLGPKRLAQRVVHADFVSADSGTGLVHCAPGHGMDDYKLCLEYDIEPFAPIDDAGCFTAEALPAEPGRLLHKSVLDEGNFAVLKLLAEKNVLVGKYKHKHKYPYDWRSKKPVIVRATSQWFADVGETEETALKALDAVRFIPDAGKTRLSAFVRNRSEWCISRQRAWGVPIPALYHKETEEALLTSESIAHIISVIRERGSDAWWTNVEFDPAWVLPTMRDRGSWRRGRDTMDVWFDSGSSWMEMRTDQKGVPCVADLYLEGSDQHRGWFQSSLLTKIAYQMAASKDVPPAAPYKTLITHGFTLDEHGRKMSKSEGNVISPDEITSGTLLPPMKQKKGKGISTTGTTRPVHDGMGPDALRLWVAGSDFTKDIVIGQPVLKGVNQSLSKFRVTFKLLLGALDTLPPNTQRAFDKLSPLNQIALIQLNKLKSVVQESCSNYEYHRATAAIVQYVNVDFSAFYIETIKDPLYADSVDSPLRIDIQLVLWEIYKGLSSMLAPFTPLLVEEALDFLPQQLHYNPTYAAWGQNGTTTCTVAGPWENKKLEANFSTFMAINAVVKATQEQARSEKKMGSSLQSKVELYVEDTTSSAEARSLSELLFWNTNTLRDLFVVSDVSVNCPPGSPEEYISGWHYISDCEIGGGIKVKVIVYEPQEGKCERCWRYVVPKVREHTVEGQEELCDRCVEVVQELCGGKTPDP
jgi:isoleucyl-tRNA synthetase